MICSYRNHEILSIRCTAAEKQLSALRDLEEEDEYVIEDMEYDSSTGISSKSGSGSGGGLQLRKGSSNYEESSVAFASGSASSSSTAFKRNRGSIVPTAKVISDLEKLGVKPGVGVTTAVNFIDSWTMTMAR